MDVFAEVARNRNQPSGRRPSWQRPSILSRPLISNSDAIKAALDALSLRHDFDKAVELLAPFAADSQGSNQEATLWWRLAKLGQGNLAEVPLNSGPAEIDLLEYGAWLACVAPATRRSGSERRDIAYRLRHQLPQTSLWTAIPCVRTLVRGVLELLDVTDSVPWDDREFGNAPHIRVIPWLEWCRYRRELNSSASQPVAARDCGHSAADWSLEQWCSLYQPWRPKNDLEDARKTLTRRETELPDSLRSGFQTIRGCRAGRFSGTDHSEMERVTNLMGETITKVAAWPFGPTWERWWCWEADFERRFWQAWYKLQCVPESETSHHASFWEALRVELDEVPWLLSATWLPIILFWEAVAIVRHDPVRATEVWRGLLGGLLDEPARGRLAMLAVKQGRIDSAREYLDVAEMGCPDILWATAQVHRADGDDEQAQQCVQELIRVASDSPSRIASQARRWLSRIAERHRNWGTAEKLLCDQTAVHPADGTAAAELGQLLLKKTLAVGATQPGPASSPWFGDASDWDDIREQFQVAEQRGVSVPEKSLAEIVPSSSTPDELLSRLTEAGFSSSVVRHWRQLLARRLLAARGPEKSLDLLKSFVDGTSSGAAHRAALILNAWRVLTIEQPSCDHSDRQRVWQLFLKQWRDTVRRLPPHAKDQHVMRWETLVEQADSMLQAAYANSDFVVPPGMEPAWEAIRRIQQLWNSAADDRASAVDWLKRASEDGLVWTSTQRQWVELHLMLAENDIEALARLDPKIIGDAHQIGFTSAELWVRSALARWHRGEIEQLSELLSLEIDESSVDDWWPLYEVVRLACQAVIQSRSGLAWNAARNLGEFLKSQATE